MGQYYYTVNIDKKQYLHPHKFNDGLKLLEFGSSADGTMTVLAILLADGNNRGGGDLRSENSIIGSWAGDRIAIAGDYADSYKFIPKKDKDKLYQRCLKDQQDRDLDEKTKKEYAEANCNLHNFAQYFFEDISEKVIAAMTDDPYLKKSLTEDRHISLKPDLVLTVKKT